MAKVTVINILIILAIFLNLLAHFASGPIVLVPDHAVPVGGTFRDNVSIAGASACRQDEHPCGNEKNDYPIQNAHLPPTEKGIRFLEEFDSGWCVNERLRAMKNRRKFKSGSREPIMLLLKL
jgi:hypothetical protein